MPGGLPAGSRVTRGPVLSLSEWAQGVAVTAGA